MQFAHFQFDPETDRLGEGPLSEVFRAVDLQLGRTVALKILRGNVEIDPAADHRFLREAKHTSNLAHPAIATIYEYGKDQGTSFIAMEYLQGRTLDKIIKEQTLGYEECVRIALQVTSALHLVHKTGLIHRDLKPGNIMVMDDGTVKLLDFGIARAKNESNITQHGMLVGTVLYMSPEQVRGDDLDARSDVFALGSVLYHTTTGQLPYPGKSFPEVCMAILDGKVKRPSQVRLGFPPALEEFVMKCLAANPDERFADAGAAHGALLSISDGVATHNGTVASGNLSGSILIPPLRCGGSHPQSCAVMAGSLRKDLAGAILRIKDLKASLLEDDALPDDIPFDYVLRCALDVVDAHGELDLLLERYESNASPGRTPRLVDAWRDKVEYSDKNEFGLQEGLVRTALRAVKKHISEASLRPMQTAQRNEEGGRAHAARAHEILHRGTTKHLLASISSFRRAIDEDPFCAVAYAGMAEAMVRKYLYWDGETKFLDEAREEAARALALDPNCAEAHTSLGFAWHISGQTTDAQREYRLAIQIENDEWLAHRLLGAVLARAGNFKNASPLLQRAIALHPTHIGSYDHLYCVLQRMNRYEEAIQIADEGIGAARAHLAKAPDNMEARLHMAMLLARMGRGDEARTEIQRGRELAPKDGYTAFHAACVYAQIAELGEAIECLKTAQSRGYFIQAELARNTDLDVLRGLPEFQALVG
jgi:serine/threonine protein kinase/thioredoxin-like negative regulator of GroEL